MVAIGKRIMHAKNGTIQNFKIMLEFYQLFVNLYFKNNGSNRVINSKSFGVTRNGAKCLFTLYVPLYSRNRM